MKKLLGIMLAISMFTSCVRLEDIRFTDSNNDLLNLLLLSTTAVTTGSTTHSPYHWARRIATDGKTYANIHDEGVAVITDSQGNVYWLTYTACNTGNEVNFAESWGGSDIQPIANDASNTHSAITKINADGSYAWTKFIGEPKLGAPSAYVLSVDSHNNIYVAGKFNNTVNFQYAWGGTDNKTSTGAGAFITKINADGTYGGTKIIPSSSGQQVYILALAIDAYDNIFCAGNFWTGGTTLNFAADWSGTDNKTPVGQTDVFIMKINSDTSYGWVRQIGGSWTDQCAAIAIDAARSCLYITGTYNFGTSDVNSTLNFASDFSGTDTKTGSGTTYPDGFVTKIDISGSTPAYSWTRVFGNGSNFFSATPSDIKTDSVCNIFLLGTFTGTNMNFAQDFGGSDIKTAAGGTVDIFITKINADGSYGLTRRIDGGFPNNELSSSLAVDSAGNIYLSGVFFNTLNFADDFGSSDSKTPDGASDIFITKLSNSLSYGYTKIFGTSGNERFGYNQWGSQNLCTYAGVLYLTANFRQDDGGSALDFNMAKDFDYTDLQSTVRNADAFIVKLEL